MVGHHGVPHTAGSSLYRRRVFLSACALAVCALCCPQAAIGFSLGDMNCDGAVDFADIDPFVLALTDAAAYGSAYPNCDLLLADVNGDGAVNFADVNPFAALLLNDPGENEPPVAVPGPDLTCQPGETIVFDGSESYDPDGEITAYEWHFRNVNDDSTFTLDDPNVQVTFAQAARYAVTLTVEDNDGASSTSDPISVQVGLLAAFRVEKLVSIEPAPEGTWAAVGLDPNYPIEYGCQVRLNGRDYSAGAVIYRWRKNGSTCGTNPIEMKTYTGPDQFDLKLTVYDAGAQHSTYVTSRVYVSGPLMQFLDVGAPVGQNALGLALDGSVAWVCHGWDTLSTFNVSNPADVQEIGRVPAPAALAVAVSNGLLYLACNGSGLRVYEAVAPQPALICTYDTYASDGQYVIDVAAAGNVAYVSAGPAGFKVLDMSAPASPRLLGCVPLPGGAHARYLTVAGGLACLTDNQNRVHLIDVSAIDVSNPQPAPPVLVKTLGSPYYLGNLALSANGLLAFTASDGIKLYSVSDPPNAQLLSTLNLAAQTGRQPSGMLFVADKLYAGFSPWVGYDMQVARINVADPNAPYAMEYLPISGTLVAGNITDPVFISGALCWKNDCGDVLTVRVPEH